MKSLLSNSVVKQDIAYIVQEKCVEWEKFAGKRIAVTGATGLLGRLTVLALLEAEKKYHLGLKVLAFVRNTEKAMSIFEEDICDTLEFVKHEITSPVPESVQADYLIHGASVTASKLMVEQPVETIMTTVNGTCSMLEFARRCHMEGMVYLSSMEVYGVVDASVKEVFENDLGYINPINIRSSYSEGKRLAECLCASYAEEYGVKVRMARLAQTFGAGIDKSENRVFAQFAKSVLRGSDIVLHTKGDKANCYCYTSDAVTALLVLLTKGECGQAYNVANMDTFCSIKEMAEIFASVKASCPSKVVIDIPEDVAKYGYAPSSIMRLNSQKMMNLQWNPKMSMKDMAIRLMRSMEEDV